MDHEWSTSALGAEQVGWDWFSIQLDDNAELMVFQLRRADGSVDAFFQRHADRGGRLDTEARTRDFRLEVTGRWRSPRTGGEYPAGWTLAVPAADLRLTITPYLADQEMQVSYAYWEGAVKVEGMSGGRGGHGQRVCGIDGICGEHAGAV